MSWMVPDHFPPWTAFHTEVPAFFVCALILPVYWRSGISSIKIPLAVFLPIGLMGVVLAQWAGGLLIYVGDFWIACVYLGTFALAWFWGYQWAQPKHGDQFVEQLSLFILGIGLLTAFQIFAQWLHVEGAFGGWVIDGEWVVDGITNSRPRANVGQPNQASTVLMMASVGAAILRSRGRIGLPTMWGVLVVLMAAVTVTQSRTALLAAIVLAVLYICCAEQKQLNAISRRQIFCWIFLLLGAAWAYASVDAVWLDALFSGQQSGFERIVTTHAETLRRSSNELSAVGMRVVIWKQLLFALYEHPWQGWGGLQISTAQQFGAALLSGTTEPTNYAHNIILDLFVMLGLPVGGVVLMMTWVWCWSRWRPICTSTNASSVLFASIPFLIHTLLEFPHAYAYFLVLAGLLLGAIDAWSENASSLTVKTPRMAMAAFFAIWCALLIGIGREYVLAEEDFRVTRFENRRLGVTPLDYLPPQFILLTQFDDMGKAMRIRAEPNMKPEDIQVLERVSKRNSWASMQYRTALALALNNRPTEAAQQLKIIKNVFSKGIYLQAQESFMKLQKEKYPQLGMVVMP